MSAYVYVESREREEEGEDSLENTPVYPPTHTGEERGKEEEKTDEWPSTCMRPDDVPVN